MSHYERDDYSQDAPPEDGVEIVRDDDGGITTIGGLTKNGVLAGERQPEGASAEISAQE
jgi:hypothetical protein